MHKTLHAQPPPLRKHDARSISSNNPQSETTHNDSRNTTHCCPEATPCEDSPMHSMTTLCTPYHLNCWHPHSYCFNWTHACAPNLAHTVGPRTTILWLLHLTHYTNFWNPTNGEVATSIPCESKLCYVFGVMSGYNKRSPFRCNSCSCWAARTLPQGTWSMDLGGRWSGHVKLMSSRYCTTLTM